MKKQSLADQLELKIRQINDKYKNTKKLARENIAHGGKYSSQENLRDLLRKDLKNQLPKIKLSSSRDVSHLKDMKSPKETACALALPTDIKQVRKLIDQQSISNQNSMHLCLKSTCIDRVASSSVDLEDTAIEFLENLDHGIPSGRKEAENLNAWFEKMKNKYENHDEFDVIILYCGQELLKQVYVECKSRGNLLKSILGYYHMLFHNRNIKYAEKVSTLTSDFDRKIESLKKTHSEGINSCNNKIAEMKNSIAKYLNIIDQAHEEVAFYKKKYQEMQRAYLEEQDIWRKHSMNYMREANRRGMVLNNEPHSLAIARWRKDLFEAGSKTSDKAEIDSLIVPKAILDKIENGEPLDPQELEEYKEIYMKKLNDEYEQSHKSIETQTDPESLPSHLALPEELSPSDAPPRIWEPQAYSLQVQMFSKEVQTLFIDGLNDSELLEIESILDLQTQLEGDFEEGSEPGVSPRQNSNNRSPTSSNSSYHMHYDYADMGDTPHRSPVYGEALGVVTETKSESEFHSENEEDDLEIKEFRVEGRGQRKTDGTDSSGRGERGGRERERERERERKRNRDRDREKEKEREEEFTGEIGEEEGGSSNNSDESSSGSASDNMRRRKSERNNEVSRGQGAEPKDRKFSVFEIAEESIADQESINLYNDPSEAMTSNSKDYNFSKSSRGYIKQTVTSVSPHTNEPKTRNYSVVEIREENSNMEDEQSYNPERIKAPATKKHIEKASEVSKKSEESTFGKKNPSKRLSTQARPDNPPTASAGEANRRGSLPLNLGRKSLMLKELVQGKLVNIKDAAVSLAKIVKNRKKELADLEEMIESKKRILENALNSSTDSQNDQLNGSLSRSLNRRSSFHSKNLTTTDLISKISKIIKPKTADQPEHPMQLSEENRGLIENLLVALKKDQAKPARLRNATLTSSSLSNTPVREAKGDFEEEVNFPENYDQGAWKNGYSVGYSRGKTSGFSSGKTVGREEGVIEGYMQAVKEINEDDSLLEDSDQENPKGSANTEDMLGLVIPQPKKSRRPSGGNEIIKSTKELTKFAEFKFAKQKALLIKTASPALVLIKKLLSKNTESILKKATISRKMINKMISNNYQIAISKIASESIDELLIISYEELSQKYGLKKVTDRKFLEFIASVIKNKQYKKCFVFMRLSGLGSLNKADNYSKFTLTLYLESLQYMLNSKIGITMNYEESEDKNLFPINRAIECVKEKLESRVDRSGMLVLISNLEHKAVPDPQRISTALIDLEYTLELMCDTYETAQKSIKKGVEMVLFALGYSETQSILQYDFGIIVRAMAPSKYQRFEDEDNLSQEITLEEAVELSVDLHILSENDVNAFAKNYQKKPFDNYSELDMVIEKMKRSQGEWISVSEEEWKKRIDKVAKKWDENNVFAIIAWRIYEQELMRINNEYL